MKCTVTYCVMCILSIATCRKCIASPIGSPSVQLANIPPTRPLPTSKGDKVVTVITTRFLTQTQDSSTDEVPGPTRVEDWVIIVSVLCAIIGFIVLVPCVLLTCVVFLIKIKDAAEVQDNGLWLCVVGGLHYTWKLLLYLWWGIVFTWKLLLCRCCCQCQCPENMVNMVSLRQRKVNPEEISRNFQDIQEESGTTGLSCVELQTISDMNF